MKGQERHEENYTGSCSRKTKIRLITILIGAFFLWCFIGSWQFAVTAQPRSVEEEDLAPPEDEGPSAPVIEQRKPLPLPDEEAFPSATEEQPSPPTTTEEEQST